MTPRKTSLVVALSLCLAPIGCAKNNIDTASPGAERGGAGADGNNSAPDSLSNGNGAPDPDKTSLTEPSTPPGDTADSDAGAGTSSPPK